MSYYRQQLENWLQQLDVKADTVFDLGGSQLPVKGRTKSWDVKNYEIYDLPDYDIELPQEIGEADIIFCLEVFEYLIFPVDAMMNIYSSLKLGGKAYITFAFVYPHHNELELDSLRYTETGVRRIAQQTGLTVTNIWHRRDKSGLLEAMYRTDGMKMARQYYEHNTTGFIVEVTK